jgi:glycosyltransferase involved in cell wall biosynthesis
MSGVISWYTPPVGDAVGYGHAAVATIEALQEQDVQVYYDRDEPLVYISFVQPDWYRGLNDQYRIGYTPWESSELPEQWISKMQAMDEIWTPSTYNKEVFESYNVNDTIHIVPHGIDQELWTIEDRYISDKFMFFHVGGPTGRKGGRMVGDAFLDLFGDNEDVILVMKSNGPSEARWLDKQGNFGNIDRHPRVKVIDFKISTEDMVKLYHSAHCLVYPTNGEGFGMIPFQGIATGLPTICTNATACTDYAEMSVPLDWTPAQGNGIHLGEWAQPSYDDLCDKMLYVYNNYHEVKEKTLQSARILHTTQTWGHVATQIKTILGEKIFQKV